MCLARHVTRLVRCAKKGPSPEAMSQRGLSLVEVLVSLSIIMLSVAGFNHSISTLRHLQSIAQRESSRQQTFYDHVMQYVGTSGVRNLTSLYVDLPRQHEGRRQGGEQDGSRIECRSSAFGTSPAHTRLVGAVLDRVRCVLPAEDDLRELSLEILVSRFTQTSLMGVPSSPLPTFERIR